MFFVLHVDATGIQDINIIYRWPLMSDWSQIPPSDILENNKSEVNVEFFASNSVKNKHPTQEGRSNTPKLA